MTAEGDDASAIGDAAFVLLLRERGVRDMGVLRAMEQVPRERFAPAALRAHARRDIALPLPCGQSMTAPTTVAAMLGLLAVPAGARVLEIGTGSGYVTALLVHLGSGHVQSLERYAGLARAARDRLGSDLVDATVEITDGLDASAIGERRFDRILLNGTCLEIPPHLAKALAPGGRLVGAVATGQGARLAIVDRAVDGGVATRTDMACRLPPLTAGRAHVL
ncbi:protein-L-isoaspartate O-methyltransferase family protein [Methylobacterium haplocladii]|uniref:Protein-L-isoaspartate O-methyltransferase n=1 Tax=Methylobacterium haplocladii TaxID=1176176 RepID=A0A512IP15_9HYPH|nr:protein-L-isoaspartate O-methyltransferase [Methylobacterium haplocladii]GEO99443.1 protein-L-isoaspartate O-methyltransferase [Methylobacterium haplocladii]GJD83272.1 Protein-L-isoaspartate O-methyltransferase [Methylobacterium haplocladii]GLS58920.1 protein-L-isoaspartate O-methyltransferase [Methylobacterium haplocladii]